MKRIDSPTFKSLVKQNDIVTLESSLLVKDAVSKIENLDRRRLKFVISTADVDRHKDRIMLNAWDNLDDYMKNPVVLWAHDDSHPPIAKCIDIIKDKKALYGVAEFVDRDMPVIGEFADMVLRMCQKGFMQATSVGFMPLSYEETNDETRGAGTEMPGYDFHRADLMEFSVVPVPANPKALMAKSLLTDALQNSTRSLNTKRRTCHKKRLAILGLM